MKKLRIWLDDERKMPKGYDVHLKHPKNVIELISQNLVEFVSIDNDLGKNIPEGRTVAEYIEQNYILGKIDFVDFKPHTGNTVAWDAIMACKKAIYKSKNK